MLVNDNNSSLYAHTAYYKAILLQQWREMTNAKITVSLKGCVIIERKLPT